MHLVNYEEAIGERDKGLAALEVSAAKNAKHLAWLWAETAASHALNCGIADAFQYLGNGRYPELEILGKMLEEKANVPPTIDGVLSLAAMLPSGLNDHRASLKLTEEVGEFQLALVSLDAEGCYTEAADVIYYLCKVIDRLANQLDTSPEKLFELAVAKYSLRARPGNPKNDAEERRACAAVLAGK